MLDLAGPLLRGGIDDLGLPALPFWLKPQTFQPHSPLEAHRAACAMVCSADVGTGVLDLGLEGRHPHVGGGSSPGCTNTSSEPATGAGVGKTSPDRVRFVIVEVTRDYPVFFVYPCCGQLQSA